MQECRHLVERKQFAVACRKLRGLVRNAQRQVLVKALEFARHAIESLRQMAEFIARFDLQAGGEFALFNTGQTPFQTPHGQHEPRVEQVHDCDGAKAGQCQSASCERLSHAVLRAFSCSIRRTSASACNEGGQPGEIQ